jgi:hypothetical protein
MLGYFIVGFGGLACSAGGWWLCAVGRPTQKPPYLSEHGKISSDVCSMRLFPAKITSLLRTSRIASPTTSDSNTYIKNFNRTYLSESLRVHGDMNITCE